MDCSRFYKNNKLIPWCDIPSWYVQFLATSPPNQETEMAAKDEMKKRRKPSIWLRWLT